MVVRTIDTNVLEANRIVEEKALFIFRNEKNKLQDGDMIQFRVVKNRKVIPHEINTRQYAVTAVMNHYNAPVEKGYQFIGFVKREDL